ncbi:hypothetical protein DLJ53_24505 [Acuticoccus sediminis]|uniref:O-antigen/teichoic acid export membrane protein n=1 Tax=Acuticoccus sediminis TaxID=2184697 RepID=A0A8B2NPF0_9HYPH|nr:oligosaccharide flippase family protein [Acuticoccus sediminis]RAH98800.1 hypothetical protein DLJ53_24505 [Acuticoccus sediminis]
MSDASNRERTEPVVHTHVAVDRMKVMINGASSVVTRLLNVFVLVFIFKYLLGRISPEEFAIYPIMMSTMVVAPFFFVFFTGGVSRYVVAAYAVDDRQKVTEIVTSITPLLVLTALAFVAGGLTLAAFAGPILAIPDAQLGMARTMLSLLVLSYALQMIALPFGVGFQVRQRFVEWNILGLMRDALRIVILFALLASQGPAVIWVVVATVSADMVHLTVVTIRSRMMAPDLRVSASSFQWTTARTLVSFGLWTTLGRLAQVFYISAGTLVLGRYGTAVDVVNYYFATALFQQINGLLTYARLPLQPSLVAMHTLADRERLRRTALRGATYGLWAALLVALPVAIMSDDIATIVLGPAHTEAATVLSLLMAIFLFSQPAGLLPMLAVATGEVRAFNLAALMSTIASFLAMIVAVLGFGTGAVGVATSLFVVTALAQIVYFWPMQLRVTGMTSGDFARSILRGMIPATGAAVVLAGAAAYGTPDLTTLIAAVAVGGIVYAIILLLFCLDTADRALVQRIRERILPQLRRTQAA